jgi:methylmalonyl-CoA mutase cobalamin-binding domain/chain
MIDEIRKQLLNMILTADRANADKLLEDFGEKYGYNNAVIQILEPVLEQIGLFWESNQGVSLAQAYVAAKISEDFMSKIAAGKDPAAETAGKKGGVVLGNIEDDFHLLGRKMVAIFLRSAGWDVRDLGNDVSAAEFVDKAVETGARFIGVSAMMYSSAINIKKVREELDRRGLSGKIKLVAGGAVFRLRPELLSEVGGDATAANAIIAPGVFDALIKEMNESEARDE